MQSEPGPSVQPRVRHDRRHGRRQAPLDRREDRRRRPAEEPDRRGRHGRTARPHGRWTCECGRTSGRDRRRTARPHWRRTGELRKHRSRRQANRCERYADGQRQECLPGHYNLRFRFASQEPAPARPARESGSTNGCRARGQQSHALAGNRRDRGRSGTTPHRAPAGTRASAECQR
jgi:hypothetical protein